jgi:hypothetical protein
MGTSASLPQSEHLFLLVGSNPLPNAVAGKLLAAPGGTITLVYSNSTSHVAQRLQGWLCPQDPPKSQILPKVLRKEVQESRSASIAQNVLAALQEVNVQRVGLHYTGGTKAMSVHAYRAVERWAHEQRKKGTEIETVFSYLDARTLKMVFDPPNPASGEGSREEYAALEVRLRLGDLLRLHGWTLEKDDDPVTKAILPQSAQALIDVHLDKAAAGQWGEWVQKTLEPCARKGEDKWKNDELRKTPLAWPSCATESELGRFIATWVRETGTSTLQQLDFAAPKDNKYFAKTKHIPAWLHGKWLEHRVLDVLNGLADSLCLHECLQNIVPREVEFDVDVIALRGYQLFALSCSTESGKTLLKHKLFDAALRARQLGGDEACAALVCCSDDPDKLQQETRHVFTENVEGQPRSGNERIKVFGRRDLANLASHVKQWILGQSRGP